MVGGDARENENRSDRQSGVWYGRKRRIEGDRRTDAPTGAGAGRHTCHSRANPAVSGANPEYGSNPAAGGIRPQGRAACSRKPGSRGEDGEDHDGRAHPAHRQTDGLSRRRIAGVRGRRRHGQRHSGCSGRGGAAEWVDAFLQGARLEEQEVLDIDEEAFRQNRLASRLYGYLLTRGLEAPAAGQGMLREAMPLPRRARRRWPPVWPAICPEASSICWALERRRKLSPMRSAFPRPCWERTAWPTAGYWARIWGKRASCS
jgi:hypothetical protein